MIPGASQADVTLITTPAYGNFTATIDMENNKANEIQWQTRQHSRPISLLGTKNMITGASQAAAIWLSTV